MNVTLMDKRTNIKLQIGLKVLISVTFIIIIAIILYLQ
jgi:uncharacterized protein (UPF0333 family)